MAKKHKLLLTQLPSEIDIEFLMAVLERDLGTAEFSLQMSDKCSAAVVIFHITYTNTGNIIQVWDIDEYVNLNLQKLKLLSES